MPRLRDNLFHRRRKSLGPEDLLPLPAASPSRANYYSDDDRHIEPQQEHRKRWPRQSEIPILPQTPSIELTQPRHPPGSLDRQIITKSFSESYCLSEFSETGDSNVQVPSLPNLIRRTTHENQGMCNQLVVSGSSESRHHVPDDQLSFPLGPFIPPPPMPQRERATSVPPKEVLGQGNDVDFLYPHVPQMQRSKSERSFGLIGSSTTGVIFKSMRRSSSNVSLSSMTGDKTYQYQPLEDSSIRLIRIFPERRTVIKCEIFHVSLSDLPPYLAISYAWGDPGDTHEIEIGGYRISIPASLHGALKAVRQRDKYVLVWADALSINQKNIDERAEQIQLMPEIYSNAKSVAIWLGSNENNCAAAMDLLYQVAEYPSRAMGLLKDGAKNGDLAGVVSLFERDYWRRLWVVQEILNADDNNIMVYCGSALPLRWRTCRAASNVFCNYRHEIALCYTAFGKQYATSSRNQYSYDQVLMHQGPASLLALQTHIGSGKGSLLEVLRACRSKFASDPKDKVFGILGILPEEVRSEIPIDYGHSIKDVYTEVVDFLLKTTRRIDVICEAIHYPVHISSANLPSFVPDWSHIPQVVSLSHQFDFSAAGSMEADCEFLDKRLNKLKIAAIEIGTVKSKGTTVSTLCNSADYLMAFLHWRATLLESFDHVSRDSKLRIEEDFARTLCLGNIDPSYNPTEWLILCYTLFAKLFDERLKCIILDKDLERYINYKVENSKGKVMNAGERKELLRRCFGDRMMGRCFCITEDTEEYGLGMGSGFMQVGDLIVVPLGCSTPILLRPEGHEEYRFVGDVYINGYMHGKATADLRAKKRSLSTYVLH